MASMSNWIVERRDTRRPCIVPTSEGPVKALFHCWSNESRVVPPSVLRGGHSGGTISETVAILEFEDGAIKKLRTDDFYFDDNGTFKQWVWSVDDKE